MTDSRTLVRHRDIQNWVSARRGSPAIARERDTLGDMRSRLHLSFERARQLPSNVSVEQDGLSPCSWTTWLAELDRQQLALKVSAQDDPSFEFVERRSLN
jgi:hypothetical protein